VEGLAPGVLESLLAYDWPGNVRELENTVERAVVLAAGPRLERRDISMLGAAPVAFDLPSLRLHENVEWAERESIKRALRSAGDVKKDAAEILGLSQRALSYYLAKYKID
jgi:two-component system response regulator AtoC